MRCNDVGKYYRYVCITTKSNANPNPSHDPTTKQHAIVNIHLI